MSVMKRIIVISLLTLFVCCQNALADGNDGYEVFQSALMAFQKSDYSKAKSYFQECLNYPRFSKRKETIDRHISRCDERIAEQRQNAVAAEKRRQAKLAERKRDSLIYISVDGADSGELYNRTISAMSEVARNSRRSFCKNVDDALTVVSVFLDMRPKDSKDGFYKMAGSGTVMLGSAIENEFVGQWTVDCEATSVVDMEDAERLFMNKMNHKLGYALDNLLNGRPQDRGYYIPKQTVAVDLAEKEVGGQNLSLLYETMNGFISSVPGMTVSTALDMKRNKERDERSKIQAEYVKMESRAPVHELEGFGQVLRLSVRSEGEGLYTFIGELSEDVTGISLATAIVNGEDFGIKDLSSKNLELAAKVLAVGLGFREWKIGEYLGEYKLAHYNGMHGWVVREYVAVPDGNSWAPLSTCIYHTTADIRKSLNEDNWRLPTLDELETVRKVRRDLRVDGTYWSCTSKNKGTHVVVDFITGEQVDCKDNKSKVASFLLLREF